MDRLRVAIAGCHRMLTRQPGSHNWAAAFAAVPETTMVAVYDAGVDTRDAFVACWSEPGAAIVAFEDYAQMLREVQPDLVCVATRQTQHATQIEQAVAAGVRGILCDKPLATSLAELDRIVAACGGTEQTEPGGSPQADGPPGRRRRVPLAFGLDRRWMGRYRWARQLVSEGAIGRVTAVLTYGLQNVINHGCHWYDVALALAGDPEVAWVGGLVDDVSREPPDSRRRLDPAGRAQVGFANGVTMYVTPDGGPGLAFEVLGERGRLLLLNDARDVFLWQADSASGRLAQAPAPASGGPETPPGWEAGPAVVADLVAAMRRGGATACDVAEARRATEIGFAIHASSAAGGRLMTLSEVDRTLRIPSLPWGNE